MKKARFLKIILILGVLLTMTLTMTACGEKPAKTDANGYADQTAFLKDMAKGIQNRLAAIDDEKHANDTDEQMAVYFNALVKCELDQIAKYEDAIFEDAKFNELAHHYIHAVQMQKTGADNIRDSELFSALWNGGITVREGIIITLYERYDLPIDSNAAAYYSGVTTNNITTGTSYSNDSSQSGTASAPDNPALLVTNGKYLSGKSSEEYAYYSFTVKNNTDQIITEISLYTVFLNEEGNIVATDVGYLFNTRVAPNQSVTIETLVNRKEFGGQTTAVVDYYTYCVNNEGTSYKEYVDDSAEILIPEK